MESKFKFVDNSIYHYSFSKEMSYEENVKDCIAKIKEVEEKIFEMKLEYNKNVDEA
jgi:hypothetical protein